MIIPIIIYRDRKSDKEILEEMECKRRWEAAIEREEARKAERERKEKAEKEEKARKERERLENEYFEAARNDPWDYQFLPEGWSPFGQWHIPVITEHGSVVF